MKTLSHNSFVNKRVIVRVDFNVPIEKGVIKDTYRILATLPTIKTLLKKGCSLILISHLGRPKNGPERALSLAPIGKKLAVLLKKKVLFARTLQEARTLSQTLSRGDVLLLENIRFFKGEVENTALFAKQLALLGNAYINDAFGNSHRAHASMVGLPKLLPHAAGLLLEKEVHALQKVLVRPKRPIIAIIGGAKIESKLPLIERFLKVADGIIVGGGIANTILAAKHISIGRSIADTSVDLSWLNLTNKKFHLPVDAVVSDKLGRGALRGVRAIGNIRANEYIADVGPDSEIVFSLIIKKAGTIIWNGPLGYVEIPTFSKGTIAMAKSIAGSPAYSIVGGGDLSRVIHQLKIEKMFDHISTGGGAMLEFLSGKKLPGIEALR